MQFFWLREEISTNGASLKKKMNFDDVNKNEFLSDLTTHIGRVPEGDFF